MESPQKSLTGSSYNGFFSDSSRMFCIGDVSAEKQKLVEVAKACMEVGIEQVKPWGLLGDVGQAVYDYATQNGYSVIQEIGGHGIGLQKPSAQWEKTVLVTETGYEVLTY